MGRVNLPPQPPPGAITRAFKVQLVEWALEKQRQKLMNLPLEHNDWFLAGIAASGALAGGDAIFAMSKREPWPPPPVRRPSKRLEPRPVGRLHVVDGRSQRRAKASS